MATQRYNAVVAQYLSAKIETWFAIFMKPVYGLDRGISAFELAPSRGAIHYHSLLSTSRDEISIDICN